MTQAATSIQPSTFDPADWLPIETAAGLTGISGRTWRRRAAALAARNLARLAPPALAKGKPTWWIHRDADPRLSKCPDRGTRNQRDREALLANYPAAHVELAYAKFHWLMKWRNRCARPRLAGQTELTIAAEISADAERQSRDREGAVRLSPRTLQAWWTAYNAQDHDGRIAGIEALVPRYAGPGRGTRSPEAIEYFYGLYHTQGGQTVRTCHDATLEQAPERGWSWPTSYAATVRWLKAHDDVALSCLHRDGPATYSQRYMEYIEIDKSVLEPGELYEADHSRCDFWAVHDGVQLRPWFTNILDCRSRVIVGWHLGVSPHQDAILAAMRTAFRERAIPHKFHMDQGRDFTSALITGFTKREQRRFRRDLGPDWRDILRAQYDTLWLGVLGELGVEVIRAIPYQPWSKGQTERSFGWLHDRFDRSFATYCGKDSASKPECVDQVRRGYTRAEARAMHKRYGSEWKARAVLSLVDQSDVPTLDQAQKELTGEIALYHNRVHRGEGMDGRTPDEVWATATRLRRAEETELLSLLQARGVYRVGANGVRFRVGAGVRGYGAASPALQRYKGRDVLVTLDPDDCSYCVAYTADRKRCLGRLDSNDRIPANTGVDELREAIADINSRRKVMRRAAAEAPKRMRTASQELRARRAGKVAALRATGTDDATAAPNANIVPVRTGLEAASIPARTTVETETYRMPETDDLAELFDEDAGLRPADSAIHDDVADLYAEDQDDQGASDLDDFL